MKTIVSLICRWSCSAWPAWRVKLAIDAQRTREAEAVGRRTIGRGPPSNPASGPNASRQPAGPRSPTRQRPPVGQNPFVAATARPVHEFRGGDRPGGGGNFRLVPRPSDAGRVADRSHRQRHASCDARSSARLAEVYPKLDQFQFRPPVGQPAPADPGWSASSARLPPRPSFSPPSRRPTAPADRGGLVDRRETRAARQHTFAAIAEAAERFGPLAAKEHRRLLMVVATDEAGDDDQRVDELVPALRKAGDRRST